MRLDTVDIFFVVCHEGECSSPDRMSSCIRGLREERSPCLLTTWVRETYHAFVQIFGGSYSVCFSRHTLAMNKIPIVQSLCGRYRTTRTQVGAGR